jgi:TfoX/Sxy family transcriptional regulator of competence genes
MAFEAQLAERVRKLLSRRKGFSEKRMFGGVGFLLNDNLCCGVLRSDLILRLGVDAAQKALREYGVRPFDITGRAMQGWAMVGPAGYEEADDLARWVKLAAQFAGSLPTKEKTRRAGRGKRADG